MDGDGDGTGAALGAAETAHGVAGWYEREDLWVEILRRVRGGRERACAACTCKASLAAWRSIMVRDVSGGQELLPVLVNNASTDGIRAAGGGSDAVLPPLTPPGFAYVASNVLAAPSGEGREALLEEEEALNGRGCSCPPLESCNPKTCACCRNADGLAVYGGAWGVLQRGTSVDDFVFRECGPACGCGATCVNRQSQHGVDVPLSLQPAAGGAGWGQGLTLVQYSAQLEPFLRQTRTLDTPNKPYHPLNTSETTPKCTPCHTEYA